MNMHQLVYRDKLNLHYTTPCASCIHLICAIVVISISRVSSMLVHTPCPEASLCSLTSGLVCLQQVCFRRLHAKPHRLRKSPPRASLQLPPLRYQKPYDEKTVHRKFQRQYKTIGMVMYEHAINSPSSKMKVRKQHHSRRTCK